MMASQLQVLLNTVGLASLFCRSGASGIHLGHAGHAPVSVTRLLRHDHSGMDSMLEAEAQWHTTPSEMLHTLDLIDAPQFLRVSAVQLEALEEHHRLWKQEKEIDYKKQIRKVGRQIQLGPRPQVKPGHEVMGLSSLSSQYVGPVGVGTVQAPFGCESSDPSSLLFIPSSDANTTGSSLAEAASQCHLQEQQTVWVVFDTGSTNIWVADVFCNEGACVKKGRRRYNHTASMSFMETSSRSTISVQFGTGSLQGTQAIDEFHIGPFTVYNQTFGMIQKMVGSVFDQVAFEGIVGLAFESMSANKVPAFFDTIIREHVLEHNEFAFYLSPNSSVANAVFWGGVDPAFYDGPMTFFEVVEPYYWALELISFKIGNDTIVGDAGSGSKESNDKEVSRHEVGSEKRDTSKMIKAIVDTGTTFFTAEPDVYPEIMERLPQAPCEDITHESHPPLTYRLRATDGQPRDIVIENSQYMTSNGGSMCSPAFMRIPIPPAHGPGMLLGEVFLRHHFAVFDRGDTPNSVARIGMAPSKHDAVVLQKLKDLTKNQPAFSG